MAFEHLNSFATNLAAADEAISLDWSSFKSHQEAVNPFLVTAKRHCQVNYLDLDMSLQHCYQSNIPTL